jgi:hypothetical protein
MTGEIRANCVGRFDSAPSQGPVSRGKTPVKNGGFRRSPENPEMKEKELSTRFSVMQCHAIF